MLLLPAGKLHSVKWLETATMGYVPGYFLARHMVFFYSDKVQGSLQQPVFGKHLKSSIDTGFLWPISVVGVKWRAMFIYIVASQCNMKSTFENSISLIGLILYQRSALLFLWKLCYPIDASIQHLTTQPQVWQWDSNAKRVLMNLPLY